MHHEEYTTDEFLRMSLQQALSFSPSEQPERLPDRMPASKLDSFLRIEEAAQVLRVSKSWIYQRRDKLPFIVRLPEGPLRVSVRRLREWLDRST